MMQPSTMPRFPREVEAHPMAERLAARLADAMGPLVEDGDIAVPSLRFDESLRSAMTTAVGDGHVVRGLAGAERRLRDEKHGMTLAEARGAEPRRPRLSRLLVIADDGSQRFHRNVASLLTHHGDRLLVLRVGADEQQLGGALFGEGEVARAMLVTARPAVARILLATVGG